MFLLITWKGFASMKKFVFVLMPFKEAFNDIYMLGIKAACQSDKVYCERVDEQYYEGSILERVYNQINKADYIVADMTGQNPNVFYEVGYAHGLGKKVILITQSEADIPFDMKHYVHIIYDRNGISQLKEKIGARVEYYLSNPEENTCDSNALVPYMNGFELTEGKTTQIKMLPKPSFGSSLVKSVSYDGKIVILLYNASERLLLFENSMISLVIPNNFPVSFYSPVETPLPTGDIKKPISRSSDICIFPKDYWGITLGGTYSITVTAGTSIKGELWIQINMATYKYPFEFIFTNEGADAPV